MKIFSPGAQVTFLFLLALPFSVLGQQAKTDTLAVKSVQSVVSVLSDTLSGVQTHVLGGADSLQSVLGHQLDSLQGQLLLVQGQLDSLHRIVGREVHQLEDSLKEVLQKRQLLNQQLLDKQRLMSSPLTNVQEWQQKLSLQELQLPKADLPNVALPTDKLPVDALAWGVQLPEQGLPDAALPGVPPVDELQKELPESIADYQLPDLLQQQELLKEQLPQRVPTTLDSTTFTGENIDKEIEQQLLKQKEVQGLQQQTGLAQDPLKEYLQQDAKTLVQEQTSVLTGQEMSIENPADEDLSPAQLQKKVVDHFVGKEQALEKARADLNKHKGRFNEIKSIKELPKNPLKRHPLMGVKWHKRIQPGVQWQLGKEDAYRIDIGPRVSYLLTDKMELGAFAQARATIGKSVPSFVSFNIDKVWGYSLFGSYEVKKGIYGQISYERLNTQVILLAGQQERSGERLWVEGFRLGVGKRYTVYKSLRGYSLIEYNFSPSIHTPYRQRLQVKVGLMWNKFR